VLKITVIEDSIVLQPVI